MSYIMRRLITAAMSLLLAFSVHAEIYKWTDSNGRAHFGSQPPATEDAKVLNVIVTPPSASSKQVPKSEVADTSVGNKTKPTVKAKVKKKVVMYSTSWCSYCKKARNHFKNEGIRFVEYDVEKSASRMRQFKKLGGAGYPLILIGKNQQMQGFSTSGFDQRYSQ
ncbi:DUF4124 domain-containing protein [Gammaproteobacteria bacterium AH-315-C21]|nr:DUF4124 domain-containing protein [Gammaproteobacteria bacterium AH-315-C21]